MANSEETKSDVHVRQLKDVDRRFLYLLIFFLLIFLIQIVRYVVEFAVSRSINFDEAFREYVTCTMLNEKTNCENFPRYKSYSMPPLPYKESLF